MAFYPYATRGAYGIISGDTIRVDLAHEAVTAEEIEWDDRYGNMAMWFDVVTHEAEDGIEYADQLIINPYGNEDIPAPDSENPAFEDDFMSLIEDLSRHVTAASVGEVEMLYEIGEEMSYRLTLVSDGEKLSFRFKR